MPDRMICSVLDEMRTCSKTQNFSYLPGLVEEAQLYADRMESKLYTIHSFEVLEREVRTLKKEKKKLEAEKELEV